MSGAWAECPVCFAVVTNAQGHAAEHQQVAAWIASIARAPLPAAVHSDQPTGWPPNLPVRPVPARPTPDPVTTDTEAP